MSVKKKMNIFLLKVFTELTSLGRWWAVSQVLCTWWYVSFFFLLDGSRGSVKGLFVVSYGAVFLVVSKWASSWSALSVAEWLFIGSPACDIIPLCQWNETCGRMRRLLDAEFPPHYFLSTEWILREWITSQVLNVLMVLGSFCMSVHIFKYVRGEPDTLTKTEYPLKV